MNTGRAVTTPRPRGTREEWEFGELPESGKKESRQVGHPAESSESQVKVTEVTSQERAKN